MANPSNIDPQDVTQEDWSEESSGQQATDPICGMQVDTQASNTERSRHNSKTYYFCSADCREQFESSPSDFAE